MLNCDCYIAYNSHNLTCHLFSHIVCTICTIERTLIGATTPDQSGPGTDGSEGIFLISQISNAGVSLLDYLMSYPGHSLGGLPICRDAIDVFYGPIRLG